MFSPPCVSRAAGQAAEDTEWQDVAVLWKGWAWSQVLLCPEQRSPSLPVAYVCALSSLSRFLCPGCGWCTGVT